MARSKPEKLGKAFRRRVSLRSPRVGPASRAGIVSTGYSRGGWGASWRVAFNAAPSFDAVAICDHISDVVMAEHWHAIGEGRRAEGPEKQPELAKFGRQGREAAEGKRPDVRGYTGRSMKPFRDNIERTPIKVKARSLNRSTVREGAGALAGQRFVVNETVEATRASTTIRPDKLHESFMGLEEGRGNQFFFVTGFVAEAVDKALAVLMGYGLEGALAKGDKRERKAAKAKTR
jgi:hypothetical protein